MQIEKIRQRSLYSLAGIAIVAVLFLAVNVIGNGLFKSARLDLTEDRLFTLSEGSRKVLGEIDEPITLRFYFSRRLGREIPAVGTYGQRVRDMLEEFASLSNGKLQLELLDPEPFTDEEDRAVELGLKGVPVDQGGELVYFGLAGTNRTGEREIIPFFDQQREQFLEYDLTRVVHNLAKPEKPVIALISPLAIDGSIYSRQGGMPDDSWMIYGQLKEFFKIGKLPVDVPLIPEGVDVLMVVHPKELSDQTLYAIDQFVLRGGKAIVFVDPYSEAQILQPDPTRPVQPPQAISDLPKLLPAWGVELVPERIAGDLLAARRVSVAAESKSRVGGVDYLPWLSLKPENFNTDDPVTAEIGQMNFASAGILRLKEGVGTTVTPLITTSPQSMEIEAFKVQLNPDPVALLNDFKPGGKPLMLAARIHGPAKTAFPDGPPKDPKAEKDEDAKKEFEKRKAAHHAQSKEPINVIVIADSDMLFDRYWVQIQEFFGQRMAIPTAHNASFVINAIDNLSGSNALISLRSRGLSARPFTRIQAIQRTAEKQFRATEQALMTKLEETQKKLADLKKKGETGGVLLSAEEKAGIEEFRKETVRIRRELRDVQHALRQDIEQVESRIKAINIGLVPLVVTLFAVVLIAVRRNRRHRAKAT